MGAVPLFSGDLDSLNNTMQGRLRLASVPKTSVISSAILKQITSLTDRETDRQTDSIAIADTTIACNVSNKL